MQGIAKWKVCTQIVLQILPDLYVGKILIKLNKVYIVLCLDPKLVVGYYGWLLAGPGLRGVLRQVF